MTKSRKDPSIDTREYPEFPAYGLQREFPPLNPRQGDPRISIPVASSTKTELFIITSPNAVDTTAGPRYYPKFGGILRRVWLNCQSTQPTGTLTGDILKNGTTVFPSSGKPTIAASASVGDPKPAKDARAEFGVGDYFQPQITDLGGLTSGPVLFSIEWERIT